MKLLLNLFRVKFVLDLTVYLYLIYQEASQPIWSPSGRYLIVFNGEIYNHLELRKNLGGFGANIKSHGDTVSLAYCIDKWGINKSIDSLEGMFAIGIWDRDSSCLS